jgi:hypothetical protein
MDLKIQLAGGLLLVALGATLFVALPHKEPPSSEPATVLAPLPVVDASRFDAPVAMVDAGAPCRDANGLWHLPNPEWTPGKMCSASDPDFNGFRYSVHVAHCKRHVTQAEKDAIAVKYGIAKADYAKYEFDHFIPLSAGGSDGPENIWPQPLDEAKEKDKVEDAVYEGLKAGSMSQAEAEAKIRAWRPATCPISP